MLAVCKAYGQRLSQVEEMPTREFFLMAAYLNVEAEDQREAMRQAQEEAEDKAAAKQGKSITRFRGEGLKKRKEK